jgi:hypothetical protein
MSIDAKNKRVVAACEDLTFHNGHGAAPDQWWIAIARKENCEGR